MKWVIMLLYLLLITCIREDALGQSGEYTSVQEVMNEHLLSFKKTVSSYKNIYVIIKPDENFIKSDGGVTVVLPYLNPKYLRKGEDNFLVEFRLNSEAKHTIVKAINFRIQKRGRNKLELTNLNSGGKYVVMK